MRSASTATRGRSTFAAALASAALGIGMATSPSLAQASSTFPDFVDPTRSLASDGFNDLIAARINGAALVSGIGGNVGVPVADANGIFKRTSGTAYPASGGIYEWGGARSTFEYGVTQAASGVTSIMLQTLINVSSADGVYGVLGSGNAPLLSYNGGSQFLSATSSVFASVDAGVGMDGLPITASPNNRNYATFTWNLSSVGTAIDSFKLTWATDAHANTLAFQVDQIGAVPEPETAVMGLAALGMLAGMRRWQARRSVRPDGDIRLSTA